IMIEVWKAIMKVMAEIMGGSYGDNAYLPGSEEEGLRWGLRTRKEGPSNSKGGAFERASELRRGIYRLDSVSVLAEGRRLHPLGEYVITLYTNGKLRTRVTVMLISEAEDPSLPMSFSTTKLMLVATASKSFIASLIDMNMALISNL
ncbi:hypothetical protein Tco_1477513, partial [Tanacetum coccineum]